MRRCICGPRGPRVRRRKRRPMRAKPPEIFSVGRLATPTGPALVVTDGDRTLRAFAREDHAARIKGLLGWQDGAVELEEGRVPASLRAEVSAYLKGDLEALQAIEWRIAGTAFQQKVWNALPKIPAGKTMTYGALATKLGSPNAMRAV